MTVAEAKKYRAEKEKIVQKMQARNDFESYTYILCNLVRVSFRLLDY